MKTIARQCLALGAVLALVALPLAAQRRTAARSRAAAGTYGSRVGPHVGYNFDAAGGAALLGAQGAFPVAPAFDLYPSFDFFFIDPGSLWQLNFDARYRPRTRFAVAYFGGGLNYLRGTGGSDTNLNLFGGFESRRLRSAPFIEGRFTLGNGSAFQIVGGLSFRLR